MKKLILLISVLILFSLTGCAQNKPYAKKSVYEKQAINYVKEKYDLDLKPEKTEYDYTMGKMFEKTYNDGAYVFFDDFIVYVGGSEGSSILDNKQSKAIEEDLQKFIIGNSNMEYVTNTSSVVVTYSMPGYYFDDQVYNGDIEEFLDEWLLDSKLNIYVKCDTTNPNFIEYYSNIYKEIQNRYEKYFSNRSSSLSMYLCNPEKFMDDNMKFELRVEGAKKPENYEFIDDNPDYMYKTFHAFYKDYGDNIGWEYFERDIN